MRILLQVVLIALIFTITHAQHDHNIRTRFFNQPLDHFNVFNRRTWDMRFIQNTQFFQEGGPIFIHITADENLFGVTDEFIRGGLVHEIAQETNGLLFALEHRYFGASRPTNDTSFHNLQWLNIHQTLADIARFIAHTKENTFGAENSPVILWGRGYAGSLAIWARQKYPNLVDGAWGSSAHLNAVLEYSQTLVNMYETVSNIGGEVCGETIREAFQIIEDAFFQGNTSWVQERLRLCYELDSGNIYDLARLDYSLMFESFRFIKYTTYPEIDEKCMIITGQDRPDDPPLNALDGFARWYIDDLNPNRDCFDYSNDVVVQQYADPLWDSVSTIDGRRQMLWLLCTQYGHFPITNEGTEHPFGRRFEMNFFKRWCSDSIGNPIFRDQWWMNDLIGLTNEHFGGLNPKTYRIFITQGELDPLRTLSPMGDLNSQARVELIHFETWSRDLGPLQAADDYPHLAYVKGLVREAIFQWIEQAGAEQPTPPPPPTEPPPIQPGEY